jgi:regulator of sigma E protease
VARLCGVKVLRFSVGFGKVILRRTDRHGTEWAVSALPLGGYVKMQDDPPAGASPAEVAGAFNSKPVGQRIAIVAAGPIFNLILAVFLYAGLNMAGTEEPVAVIAQPAADTPAARAGLLSGDRILAIDGEEVASWSDARWRLMDVMATGGSARIEVKTPAGAVQQRELALPSNTMDPAGGDPLAAAGVRLAQPKPAVRVVNDGGEGQAAGLRTGDLILAVNGVPTPDTGALVRQIQESAGKTLALTLARDGANISLNATPRAETVNGQVIGRLGVQLGGDVPMVTVRYGVFESLWKGAVRTWDTAWFSLRMMGRMITGDVSWRNVSGPVTIADYAGQTARIGIVAYIAYIALISISLGVLNLLPIPMLDGGHLLYYLVEIVRGSPPPARWIDIGQRAGIGLLASLMGLALFNDFTRLFT